MKTNKVVYYLKKLLIFLVKMCIRDRAKARKIAPTGIIGFNIMTALRDYEGHVRAAVEALSLIHI